MPYTQGNYGAMVIVFHMNIFFKLYIALCMIVFVFVYCM